MNKNTYLIRVALASGNPEEAALIVNAVVDAYLDQHTEYHRSANKALHKSLAEELEKLAKEILEKKNELKALVDKGHVQFGRAHPKLNPAKDDDPGVQTAFTNVTEEQYTQTTNTLLQTEMELLEAQADARGGPEPTRQDQAADEPESRTQESAEQLEARVEEEFLKDPEVVALAGRDQSGRREELENAQVAC